MKYIKKPVEIEAVIWDPINYSEVSLFMSRTPILKGKLLEIETLEGIMYASPGDYIVKGIEGEFYPVKPDIFKKTYEEVKND